MVRISFLIIDGLFDHLLVNVNLNCFSVFLCRSFLLVVPMSTLSFTMKTQVPLQIHSQTHRYKGLCVLCIQTLYNFHFVWGESILIVKNLAIRAALAAVAAPVALGPSFALTRQGNLTFFKGTLCPIMGTLDGSVSKHWAPFLIFIRVCAWHSKGFMQKYACSVPCPCPLPYFCKEPLLLHWRCCFVLADTNHRKPVMFCTCQAALSGIIIDMYSL